jgi:hypothetical protein
MGNSTIHTLFDDWLLYHCPEEYLNNYKQHAVYYENYIGELFDEKYPTLNMHAPICNMWLALQAHFLPIYPLFFKEEFRLAYRAGMFMLEFVETSKHVRYFLNKNHFSSNNELIFLSIHLVKELNVWLEGLVEHKFQDIYNLYLHEDRLYERDIQDEKFVESQYNQKHFMYYINENINASNDLLIALENAFISCELSFNQIIKEVASST